MNEYYEAFQELQDKNTFKGQQWFGERQELVEEYSWAVPNEEALLYLSEFENIIEVGAGSGYWAYCINEAGGDVLATDANPPPETYTDVKQAYVDELDLTDSVVLMVWPPCGDAMASMVAAQSPAHILYVGEIKGGCTASDGFFDIIHKKYGVVGKIDIPSYAGVNDDLFHYVRKT